MDPIGICIGIVCLASSLWAYVHAWRTNSAAVVPVAIMNLFIGSLVLVVAVAK